MIVTPHLALETILLDELDLLIVCGGTIWKTDLPPNIVALVAAAHERNIVVAGICDGTRVLAQSGVLDNLRHTSNSAENLSELNYGGAGLLSGCPLCSCRSACRHSSGTAPVSFMAEILRTLGISDENLNAYLAMHAAEHSKSA
ncbi:DJ-1/PfpI family protein [Cupriavidus basilensis]